jgi:hypothetical protein
VIPWRRSHVVAVQVHASPIRPHNLRREALETRNACFDLVLQHVRRTPRPGEAAFHPWSGNRA